MISFDRHGADRKFKPHSRPGRFVERAPARARADRRQALRGNAGAGAARTVRIALLQPTALQAGLELLLHMAAQRPSGLGAQLTEGGVVLLDARSASCVVPADGP
jgi:hypothetical protein